MRKTPYRNWSLLGLVLYIASGVAAAVAPKQSKETVSADGNGWLYLISNDGFNVQVTCISTAYPLGDCHETTSGEGGYSMTTMDGFTSYDAFDNDYFDNNTTFD